MAKLIYRRNNRQITFIADDGSETAFEARYAFFSGRNEAGEPHETLPDGIYTCVAEEPPAEDSDAYGTFYIDTGDPRGRVIHGGGSGLDDPKAPRQGWYPTLGCIRCQNEDGEKLSRLIIDAGNSVSLTVID